MLGKIRTVCPEKIDRWWEKELPTTGEQPVQAPSDVWLVNIGVVASVIIVAALVFALLLRRRHGRSPS